MKNIKFTIITFYQFKKIKKIDNLQLFLKDFCSFHKIKGTILIAKEGINGTVAGLADPIDLLEKELNKIKFNNLEYKKSSHQYMPFNSLKVKIKKEIVTFNNLNVDVEKFKGKHVDPKDWSKLINDDQTIVIDVRNNFEVQLGSFKGSINPKTENFSEFKEYIKKDLNKSNNETIAMYCTGGIRCEKASSYMSEKGFKNVFQLKGGILKYLEEVPLKDSEWEGECFVFDSRVSVKNEMKDGTYELCHACRNPVSISDRQSKNYEKGISCPKCKNIISEEKKIKLRERNKQIDLAKKNGLYNPYIKYTPSDFS